VGRPDRLEEPKKHNLSLLQKLKLYDGKTLPGYTQDNVKELRKEAKREGMDGISPRYVQDKISNALVSERRARAPSTRSWCSTSSRAACAPLAHHQRGAAQALPRPARRGEAGVRGHRQERGPARHQRRRGRHQALCANYIDNVKAYTQKEKVKNRYTGQDEEPDERLMRSIEEKIDIPESRKDDFRREIMNYIGALAVEGKKFDYSTNERLHRALEQKLFEDQKDSIKLKSLVSNVIDKETQEKIDVVKQRMIKNFGYNDESATDVLNYVASIFARGDAKKRSAGEPAPACLDDRASAGPQPLSADRPGQDPPEPQAVHLQGELIGKQGKDLVSIPLPQIEHAALQVRPKDTGGVGQGDGEPGDSLGPGDGQQPGQGKEKAGEGEGEKASRSTSPSTSWPRSSARSWSCRASSPRARSRS
jgi:hypothetical protein